MTEARIRALEKFTSSRFSETLISSAGRAVELTRSAHQLCENLKLAADQAAEFPQLSTAELYVFAKTNMDEADELLKVETGITTEILSLAREARNAVLELILKELANEDSNRSLLDLPNERFGSNGNNVKRHAASLQAVLLDSQKRLISSQIETLQSTALLGLLWRGFFTIALSTIKGACSIGR